MGLKWLITGGCGFIGRNLIKQLLSDPNNFIRVVDDLSVGTREDLSHVCHFTELEPDSIPVADEQHQVTLVQADIRSTDFAVAVSKGIDVIVHLAANTGVAPSVENPHKDCLINVIGTLNYLEAAKVNGIKKFIFASSGAPAGECSPPIHEELPPHPVSPYGASKLAGEGYCSSYCRTFGVQTVALRFGNVYGPYSFKKDSVVAKFIKQAMAGKDLEIYGDGSQTRDFIYIEDLIRAVILAQRSDQAGGETFQIASNRETTINELLEVLIPILNQEGFKNFNVINGQKRLGDVMRNFSDTTKAKNRLGWQSEYDLESGLLETVNWFVCQNQGLKE